MERISFDLQQLQAFVAVAERGSFRAAAEELHLSSPALSRRIERLETILGAKLFHRTTRMVKLTPLGRTFLERARTALDDLEAAMLGISDIAGRRIGRVTVACVPSAALHFLPSVVGSFSEKFPKIRIRLMDEAAGQVVASVLAGECDFGIAFMSSQVPGIDFLPIHEDEFVLAMPRGHAMAKRRSLSWGELADEKLIAVARSSGNRQLLDNALARAGRNPSYRFEVSHIATLLGMVEAGLGMAAVPRLALPVNHPTLVGVSLRDPSIARQIGLTTLRGSTLSAPSQIFYEHLRLALEAKRRSKSA